MSSSDVDYSQYDSEILQLMHSQKLYPPRFVVNVSMPHNVRTGTTAIFQFKGADKILRRELPLQFPTLGEGLQCQSGRQYIGVEAKITTEILLELGKVWH